MGMIYFDSVEKAGHLASLAASKVVSQMGARMQEDYKALIEQVLKNNKIKNEKVLFLYFGIIMPNFVKQFKFGSGEVCAFPN